jgi:MraZ protein
MVFATATKVDVDKIGRILIPQFLRKAADLEGSVTVVGSGGYFEIWSSKSWENQQKEIDDIQNDPTLFETLDLPPVL